MYVFSLNSHIKVLTRVLEDRACKKVIWANWGYRDRICGLASWVSESRGLPLNLKTDLILEAHTVERELTPKCCPLAPSCPDFIDLMS